MATTSALRAWKKDYRARRANVSVQEALFQQHIERVYFACHRIVLLRADGLPATAMTDKLNAVRIENAGGLELHYNTVRDIPDLLGTVEDMLARTYAAQRYA